MARIRKSILSVSLLCALTAGLVLPAATPVAYAATTTSKSAKAAKAKPAKKATAGKAKAAPTKKRAAKPAAPRKAVAAAGIRHASYAPSAALEDADGNLSLRSSVAFVQDLNSSDVLFAKNEGAVAPIASITKLMTALVVVDAGQPLDEMIEVTTDDIDTHKFTHSRLSVGTRLSRADMLHLALMSSENRAANALGRNYPGGLPAFVQAMNAKAVALGMQDTHYVEPTGLSSENVSSARDLVRLMREGSQRPLIRQYTTDTEYAVDVAGRQQTFRNTNRLVARSDWNIIVSKTGFINEAGRCLVMLANIGGRDMAIVLLDSVGSLTRTADAQRIRQWVQREIGAL
ncbi:D-alanyl-D-alanine endopeptidase [Pigmentiphaga sp.]|uniref:D-alanyl-D-alanine endopeptidase n=1 Tax=Pigmentiphaga sp. TaxID=1977564 RepID=UPI00128C0C8C|nr:D-alanyl-D-alanine endopeptidase [Pigmentiphaga sp.]MPS30711.1 D-alanyl-D-alanine endopeptidase [Alcaligenaceae bacterium SAGV5]MPS52841.1 D-alanyl-D-alanine endopeptidase [Alcaligenaceae bacterium SAGV3]MPT60434.1 D-alanyl-D-alanine endopeptidase [Alcaligenaceae bacterium]